MTRSEANGWISYAAWSVAVIAAICILVRTTEPAWVMTLPPFIMATLITVSMYASSPKSKRENEMG